MILAKSTRNYTSHSYGIRILFHFTLPLQHRSLSIAIKIIHGKNRLIVSCWFRYYGKRTLSDFKIKLNLSTFSRRLHVALQNEHAAACRCHWSRSNRCFCGLFPIKEEARSENYSCGKNRNCASSFRKEWRFPGFRLVSTQHTKLAVADYFLHSY
jgi:hypothetical protein